MKPLAYGIDFGTTNSSIAVAYPDRTEVVDVSTQGISSVLPSIVYLHREGIQAAGEEAVRQYLVTGSRKTRCGNCSLVDRVSGTAYTECRQYKPGGFCQDSRIATELKSALADSGFTSTHSWAKDFDLPDLVGIVFRELKRAADQLTGSDTRRAVIGFPVIFAGAEGPEFEGLQTLALERLTAAAAKSGIEEVELLEEPAAAVVDEELQRGLVVVVDFGGGTFDVAVVDLSPEQGEVIALQGAAIGGERFTAMLFGAKVAPELGLDGTVYGVPAWLRVRLRTLGGVLRVLSDRDAPGLLRAARTQSPKIATIERILYGGLAYQFYRTVEDSKIELSKEPRTSIEFHRPEVDISIPVTRQEFEELIASDLEVIRHRILAALDQAGISPGQVDAVLRTGGSSSIPAFVRLLEELFEQSKVEERPVYTTVVKGLAAYARGRWAA
jgi:hypothetical chaperone protein